MAVTIQIEPEDYIRVYDTNVAYYRIYSSLYQEINFNFLIKIKNTVGDTLSILKLTSNIDGLGFYNPTSYLKNYLTSDIDILTDTLVDCANSYGEYTLDFYEQYGDPIIEYTGTTASTKFYYNGCQSYYNYNYDYGALHWIIADGSTDGHILSPTNKFYLDPDEKMWIYFISSGSTNLDIDYSFYDSDGLLISTISYPMTLVPNTMYSVGAGPNNIPTGSTPSNWNYYTINFLNISQDYFGSDLPIVYRKNKCKTDWTEVYWLNEHGGWSNYTFNKRQYTQYKISRNTYDRYLDYGYSDVSSLTPQREVTQFNTKVDKQITLNTDWINEYENILIKSLMISPDVRIKEVVGGVDHLIHYNIIDTKWKEMNKANDGLYQYEIKLVPSNKKVIQSF